MTVSLFALTTSRNNDPLIMKLANILNAINLQTESQLKLIDSKVYVKNFASGSQEWTCIIKHQTIEI